MGLASKLRKLLCGTMVIGVLSGAPIVYNAVNSDNLKAEIGQVEKKKAEARDLINPIAEGDKTIKVMSYNIAHCRGPFPDAKDDFVKNLTIKSKKQVYECLDTIAELITEEKADIVGLQETDFNATWSFGINYAKYLAEKTGLQYYAFGTKWNAAFPFVWFGKKRKIYPLLKARIGNTILSRYPIIDAENKDFDGQSFLDKLIGDESYLDARILLNGEVIRVINTHFDSESEKSRAKAAKMLVAEARKRNEPIVIIGDLNAVMPQQCRLLNQGRERTMEILINSGEFDVFMERVNPLDTKYYTSNSEKRERTIDYIIPTKEFKVVQYYVNPALYSDHFAVFAVLKMEE